MRHPANPTTRKGDDEMTWMRRAERRAWSEASTAADLRELTARWLQRDIEQHPAYPGSEGPGLETAEIADVLAELNRAGLLTVQSQPGGEGPGEGAEAGWWEQRAALEAYATPEFAEALFRALPRDLYAEAYEIDQRRRKVDYSTAVTVSAIDGADHIEFGARFSARFLRSGKGPFVGCGMDAVDEVCATMVQVVVIDPEWGRNSMWRVLGEACRIARSEVPS